MCKLYTILWRGKSVRAKLDQYGVRAKLGSNLKARIYTLINVLCWCCGNFSHSVKEKPINWRIPLNYSCSY